MKVGDLVQQTNEGITVPVGAVGIVIKEDTTQKTTPRWTVWWLCGNKMMDWAPGEHVIKETTGYGYGIEVISEVS